MKWVELTDNIFFIEGQNNGRYPFSNSLFINDESTVLIDTGLGKNVLERIIREKRVDLVINSHCHEDHINYNYLFKDAKICCHKLDAPAIRSVDELLNRYGPQENEAVKAIEIFIREIFELRESRVDVEFEDNYVFDLGNVKLKVIYTPGHSIGHCCFYVPDEKILFLSDIDLTSFGPWYGCLDSDIDHFIDSINKVKSLRPEIVITSHKGIITGNDAIEVKFNEYLDKIFERDRKLLGFLREERTIDEIVNKAIIYGQFPEPKVVFKYFERIMIEKHLHRLIRKGFVFKTKKGFKALKKSEV